MKRLFQRKLDIIAILALLLTAGFVSPQPLSSQTFPNYQSLPKQTVGLALHSKSKKGDYPPLKRNSISFHHAIDECGRWQGNLLQLYKGAQSNLCISISPDFTKGAYIIYIEPPVIVGLYFPAACAFRAPPFSA